MSAEDIRAAEQRVLAAARRQIPLSLAEEKAWNSVDWTLPLHHARRIAAEAWHRDARGDKQDSQLELQNAILALYYADSDVG